jgi:hypothetical protein
MRTRWRARALAIAWLACLAVLPWWLGLPLLLAVAAVLLLPPARLAGGSGSWRTTLYWGVPGWVLSLHLALGTDARAWVLTLLAALVAFSLLMLLHGWLGRDMARSRPAQAAASAEWRELALAPVGPAATIIELLAPAWQDVGEGVDDPRGGRLRAHGRGLQLADGRHVDGVEPRCCFGGDGRYLVLALRGDRGSLLLDRPSGRQHRLRGWQLCGWHEKEPWFNRGRDEAPLTLAHVLGQDDHDVL